MTSLRALAALLVPALLATACTTPQTTTTSAPEPVPSTELPAATRAVDVGVDVLIRDSLHVLRGKRVGLITNHTGRNARGETTIDILHRSPAVNLVALYSPEHGIRGTAEAGERVDSSIDQQTGLPVRSLYGATRVPTPEMLADVDVLVYDIQDVGARVYTYPWTMALSAEAAAKLGKSFVVLDRPNPIRADRVEGGMLDTAFRSFVGQYPTALRYGLTPGELIRWLVGAGHLRADVTVIPMRGYRRSMWWEETGLPWINPSPNLRSVDAALLYTGTVFFEGTNLSEGRGTENPFQLVGAGFLTDAPAIAAALNARNLPGVRFGATTRTIAAGQKWGGETIPMIEVTVTNRETVQPVAVGLHMLAEIHRRHGTAGHFEWRESLERLFGSRRLRQAIENGTIEALLPVLERESRAFEQATRPYRLY